MGKTGIRWTCVVSMLVSFIPTFAGAGPLDIPDDYREHANRIEFLTHVAHRCDIRLSIYGKQALTDDTCTTFLAGVPTVTDVTHARWKAVERAIYASSNQLAKHRWQAFHETLLENLAICNKVLQHITFVRTSGLAAKR